MFRPTIEVVATTPQGIFVQATRHPMFGGKITQRHIRGLTEDRLARYLAGEGLVQDLPITVADREFLLTGMTDEEQGRIFGEE